MKVRRKTKYNSVILTKIAPVLEQIRDLAKASRPTNFKFVR